mmetsp:Transcript_818/g.1590  ORF Transcript_818/g.1590 Transcript_818/m.1590 type:complete len:151 (+) Transcript_818:26-478(+)
MSFLPKIVASAIKHGASVIIKSVGETFRNAARGAPSTASEAENAATAMLSSKLRPKEARMILNVEDDATEEDIQKQFDHLFAANSPEKGNSFYLQSKVFRSHELLTALLKEQAAIDGGSNLTGIGSSDGIGTQEEPSQGTETKKSEEAKT